MTRIDSIPPYAEEQKQLIREEQLSLQEILSQFKQPIPSNFIQIETDYIFTTKSKWTKPLSERYSFTHEGKWFQIDIPHTLMEKLELPFGEEIDFPIYIAKKVLKKEPSYGAITIENEEEIFLDKPLSVKNLGSELKKWLTEIKILKDKIADLEREEKENKKSIGDLQTKNDKLANKIIKKKN